MIKRKSIFAVLLAFTILAFSVLVTHIRSNAKGKTEVSSAPAPTRSPGENTFRTTNAWLVVRNMAVERTGAWSLSQEETEVLVERAMDEVGNYGYDRNAPILVEEEKRFFTVTFPEPPHPGPAELVCCADFAIKVRFEKDTRKVTETICGG